MWHAAQLELCCIIYARFSTSFSIRSMRGCASLSSVQQLVVLDLGSFLHPPDNLLLTQSSFIFLSGRSTLGYFATAYHPPKKQTCVQHFETN